jgi:hypothetical protein
MCWNGQGITDYDYLVHISYCICKRCSKHKAHSAEGKASYVFKKEQFVLKCLSVQNECFEWCFPLSSSLMPRWNQNMCLPAAVVLDPLFW